MSPIVVIGKSGQLANELALLSGAQSIVCLGRDDIDVLNPSAIQTVLGEIAPRAIINASAYTAVDKAESEQDSAFALNATAPKLLAEYCHKANIPMVHVSTDYVFAGDSGVPYKVDDSVAPQGVYGASKAQGESAVLSLLPKTACVIRTSWVYSTFGNNFVKTMLKLMASRDTLSVVDDQIGSPTNAACLAQACLAAIEENLHGIYHWTDEGVCSWYDFACAIEQIGLEFKLLNKPITISPIPSEAYPTPAKRPHYSVLDKTKTRQAFNQVPKLHWRTQLATCMAKLAEQQ